MNAVFVRARALNSIEKVATLLARREVPVEEAVRGRLRAGDDEHHAWLFLESDPANVPAEFLANTEPFAVVIEYYSMRLLREILEALSDQPDAVVDNDHGVTTNLREFIERMSANPDWDWRVTS